jgi:hypothetical protein
MSHTHSGCYIKLFLKNIVISLYLGRISKSFQIAEVVIIVNIYNIFLMISSRAGCIHSGVEFWLGKFNPKYAI